MCLALGLACDQQRSEVQEETQELREAQKNVGEVTSQLQADLERAKAEVVRLEEKLAMARQGITDDVMAERKDLQQSLKEQQRDVQGEIKEAKQEAALHNRDTEQAAQQLEETQPPARVEAEVSTKTEVVEGARTPVETVERRELIPVKGTSVADAGSGAESPEQNTRPTAPR